MTCDKIRSELKPLHSKVESFPQVYSAYSSNGNDGIRQKRKLCDMKGSTGEIKKNTNTK